MKTKALFRFIFLFFGNILLGQSLDTSLIELNFSNSSNPSNLTKVGNKIFFSASDFRGHELWLYDSMTNETKFVKDIAPGFDNGIYNGFTPFFTSFNNKLFFVASGNAVNGGELWMSDGTEEGTLMVRDINPGPDGSFIQKFHVHNNILYFYAAHASYGSELWRSDGTSNGTYMLKDIRPGINFGSSSSEVNNFFSFNDLLIFTANNGINGNEIWVSDGTQQGTNLLKDINIGSQNSEIRNFFIFENNFYFTAINGVHGREIWKSNGTASGTNMLKDIYSGINGGFFEDSNFVVFNNSFYFFANDGLYGHKFWKSDGTSTGTILLKDINPGAVAYNYNFNGAVTSDFFVFEVNGNSLWVSDGTAVGTNFLRNISINSININLRKNFIEFNDKVIFIGDGEPWITNGTHNGTVLIKDIRVGSYSSNVNKLTKTDNYVIFYAEESFNTSAPWVTDGTTNGTFKLKDISLYQPSSNQGNFITLNSTVFFPGYNRLNGYELWKTDGSQEGTLQTQDIARNGNSIPLNYKNFTSFNNKVIFAANSGFGGEPYISDGTILGTNMIKKLRSDAVYDAVHNSVNSLSFFTKAGNNVFFRADNGINGFEVFRTNGTEGGTSMIKDIAPGSLSSLDNIDLLFYAHNDIFYFGANDYVNGRELWRSDGTADGTFMLKDIYVGNLSGIYSSNINSYMCFGEMNGFAHFMAFNGTQVAIWRTDGSSNGTTIVLELVGGSNDVSRPEIIDSNNNKIYFMRKIGSPQSINNQLWVSDGTPSGTLLLDEYSSQSIQFRTTTIVDNFLYYIVGSRLMKTDGTLQGTIVVFNNTGLNNQFLNKCGNYIYFSCNGQLWRTNGTTANTMFVDNISFSNPSCINNYLVYSSNNLIKFLSVNNIVPSQFQLNVINSDNITDIGTIFNLNNNLLFLARSVASGEEMYYSSFPSFLSDSSNLNLLTNDITIYPNPSTGIFYFKVNDDTEIKSIQIFDIYGKRIEESILKDNHLNYNKLSNGVYFLMIKTDKETFYKKVIIK